jgi:hypothetical protein
VKDASEGYPKVMRGWDNGPETVRDADWLSQPEAAVMLGIPTGRIGLLIANGHLRPAHNSAGWAGVTRQSVEMERQSRSGATWRKRASRLVRDVIRWF